MDKSKIHDYLIISKLPLISFNIFFIAGLIQFFSLWDISYEYIRFFSIGQLIQDVVVLCIPCLIVISIFYICIWWCIDSLYRLFLWINKINNIIPNKKLIFDKLLMNLFKNVTFSYVLFVMISLFLEKDYILESFVYLGFIYFFTVFYISSIIKTIILLKIIITDKKVIFNEQYLNNKYYINFVKLEYWIDLLRKHYHTSREKNTQEVDLTNVDNIIRILFFGLLIYLVLIINTNVLQKINKLDYEYLYYSNINIFSLETRIMNKYKLAYRPKFLYMNSEHIFYDINQSNNMDYLNTELKRKNQRILIIKKSELFNEKKEE